MLVFDDTIRKMSCGHSPLHLHLQYLFVDFSILKAMNVNGSLLVSLAEGRHLIWIRYIMKQLTFLANSPNDKSEIRASQGSGYTHPCSGKDLRPSVKSRFRTQYYEV